MIPLPFLQLLCLLGIVIGASLFRYRLIDEPYSIGLLLVNVLGLVILSTVAIYSMLNQSVPLSLWQWLWLVLSLLPLVAIALLVWQGTRVPAIHDISTDSQSPPAFVAATGLRTSFHHDVAYSPTAAVEQAKAYPDITTQVLTGSDREFVFNQAVEASKALGWHLSDVNLEQGRIEAYAVTSLLGFVDDIVIRIQRVDHNIEVDIRSQSRIGKSDLGANAKRIRRFQAVLLNKL